MDGCVGIVMRIISTLIILTLLNGCYCMTDTQDTSNVADYFEGCWNKVDGTGTASKVNRSTNANKPVNDK